MLSANIQLSILQASDLEPNLTLLQFVALALPALAILMQAVIRFDQSYGEENSGSTLRIEFRLLELSFAGLVGAAIFFSYGLFRETASSITQLGIGIISVSLILVFPVTWFALRRPRYPSKRYDSPEDAVKDTGKSVYSIGKVAIPIVTLLLIGRFIGGRLARDQFQNFLAIPFRDISTGLALTVLSFAVLKTSSNLIESYLSYKMEAEWVEKVETELSNISNLTLSEYNTDEPIAKKDIANEVHQIVSNLGELIDDAPHHVNEDVKKKVVSVFNELVLIRDAFENLEDVEEEIENYERQRQKAQATLENTDREIKHRSLSDFNPEPPSTDESTAEEYVSKVEMELSKLEAERSTTIDQIESGLQDLRSYVEEIQNDL